ncbi:MAG: hypothetical protein Kow00102_19320 [Spirochaetota bacterium]
MKSYPFYFYTGILLILFMQICLLLDMRMVTIWATPTLWTGLILLTDGILAKTNRSLIQNRALGTLAVISVLSWWMFEWFNIYFSNWHYQGLLQTLHIRYLGYIWAFATIFPGVLLVYGIILTIIPKILYKQFHLTSSFLIASFIIGLFFLFIPIIPFSMYYVNRAADPDLFIWLSWSANTFYSEFTAGFIWLGFIFILEPLNYLLNRPSLYAELVLGKYTKLIALMLAGLLCGYLWEFWNWWAATKWIYTVPILPHIKLFEMPILGYIGFATFAWEIYAITALVYPKAITILEREH